ncbi:hypothetical protein [Motilibacter peucedani]|uniref:hypothetical protein n=1 Tax=Motilibacter peucedani TaxID=598650 RepID=UPI001E5CCF19|nr:hypothetical protein [Motilibacter peucedani]
MAPPLLRPSFSHLRRLTDAGGLYEHAEGIVPRTAHGYCVDDVARALVVVCREADPELSGLQEQYLGFVVSAQSEDGTFRNRRSADLRWSGASSTEDWWGRALWGLGAAVRRPASSTAREAALAAFERGAVLRSRWSRAMAFAGLGAAEVLAVRPSDPLARALLADAARAVGRPAAAASWPWPELRLRYANAALPEVLVAAGSLLGDRSLLDDGLLLLGWLLEQETRDGHLSVVPVAGRGPADLGAGFDQQPIEVAALADACARALAVTGDDRWLGGIELAAAWFHGHNDGATPLVDTISGGGFDGLEVDGRNENQGAESTLAAISTLQHARALLLVGGL